MGRVGELGNEDWASIGRHTDPKTNYTEDKKQYVGDEYEYGSHVRTETSGCGELADVLGESLKNYASDRNKATQRESFFATDPIADIRSKWKALIRREVEEGLTRWDRGLTTRPPKF